MRELIFRGKTKEGKWVHGYFYEECGLTYIFEDRQKIRGLMARNLPYEVIRKTVGQYTGLKDRNGKEIYEGDLVKFNTFEEVFEVRFIEASFCVVGIEETIDYMMKCDTFEICGNIHENLTSSPEKSILDKEVK